jgi:hypothetical protein
MFPDLEGRWWTHFSEMECRFHKRELDWVLYGNKIKRVFLET